MTYQSDDYIRNAESLSDRLERGQVVRFVRCPFPLPSEQDLRFLRQEMPALTKRKNISYYPETDVVRGIKGGLLVSARMRRILKEHDRRVQAFLKVNAPALTRDWHAVACSFRLVEEQGGDLPGRARNELIHMDAGAYGATHGDRILRFFVNIHPTKNHAWDAKGILSELLLRYGRAAGITPEACGSSLEERPLARVFSRWLRRLSKMNIPLGQVLDGSPYDRAMRRFHDFMKDDLGFKNDAGGLERLEFPPYSAWAVFTDMVSHACFSGRFTLVSTFIIPKENCKFPQLVPYHALEEFLRR